MIFSKMKIETAKMYNMNICRKYRRRQFHLCNVKYEEIHSAVKYAF